MDWQGAFVPVEASGRRTVLVGLVGRGIGASRTPRMHVAAGRALGLDYRYRLLDMDEPGAPSELCPLIARLQAAGYAGINVTFPYKQAVVEHLDSVANDARVVGAVNTVVFREGKRRGENTDAWGFREAFGRGLPDVPRRSVLLLGAGGAGGAVARALLDEGVARLLIHDTISDRAAALAARLGADRAEVAGDLALAAAAADGIVNCTPVGMANMPGLPLPVDFVTPRHWVADIIYFPLETELLALARSKGCRVLSGAGMALYQAVRAFELFTGLRPDVARMQAAFEAAP